MSRRKKSERFFELIIERAFDAVVIIGADQKIMYASPSVERITGYRPKDVIGVPLSDFQVAGEREAGERFNALAEKPGTVLRVPFLHRSGVIRQVEFTSRNMLDDPELPGIIINFRDITDQVEAERSVRESRDELRDLAWHMQTRIEDERRRIAREVHDDLGQYVTALGLDVAWLQSRDPLGDPEREQRLKEMRELISATSKSVRHVARQLHGGVVEGLSLSDAIQAHMRRFAHRAHIEMVSDIQAMESNLSRGVVTAAFRIAQEALTNIARHSQATQARVVLKQSGTALHLEVHDNGSGMTDTNKRGEGLGILSMRERAGAAGGTLHVGPSPDGGVAVIARLPL